MEKIGACVQIEGIVRGIRFRSFIYGLAQQHDLKDWVLNDEKGAR